MKDLMFLPATAKDSYHPDFSFLHTFTYLLA